MTFFSVQEMMVIIGGYLNDSSTHLEDSEVIKNDGSLCKTDDFSRLPASLKGYGVAAVNDKTIFLCGGTKVTGNKINGLPSKNH